jgi:uncharacterized protein YggU (UPF0235/DUF167 family)
VPTLHFHIVPNAKINQVVGARGAAIKIKLHATAIEGKANAASLNFLADQLESQSTRSCWSAVKNHARN